MRVVPTWEKRALQTTNGSPPEKKPGAMVPTGIMRSRPAPPPPELPKNAPRIPV